MINLKSFLGISAASLLVANVVGQQAQKYPIIHNQLGTRPGIQKLPYRRYMLISNDSRILLPDPWCFNRLYLMLLAPSN